MWTPVDHIGNNGGRISVRRVLVTGACALLVAVVPHGMARADGGIDVSVREQDGTYTVAATFSVSQPASIALAVLTDYERIPRFMPNVRTSIVVGRADGRTIVEQEAVARLMMFSKRVHLVLDVEEAADGLRFRDMCGKSFEQYEGTWSVTDAGGGAAITYRLSAMPSFGVPPFLLKRLLEQDAEHMLRKLQAEITARAIN
jgi:uncharacterized membrane protein